MSIRTFVSACAMIASLALPSLASAQVRFHAGVSVGGQRPVYAQPAPVVVAQPAQPVYVQPAPPVYVQPAQPVYAQPAAPVMMRRRHGPVIIAPPGMVIDRRHGRRHHWHR